ncbi:hypothetical protein [Noviherbaspirillum autotrophicum]|uniref:Uncharacterized protein n=1 Tax=Noviherbaspirillum autotrophicum TaxID=709839 RepID=A0A0C2BTE3_9BURK|nr:hypothetical protein [Noviherbaspirillum autotrophicum]KIF83304.1 hypothetical protein TSA66_24680 [Noviherbaspirillum autotrophicum]
MTMNAIRQKNFNEFTRFALSNAPALRKGVEIASGRLVAFFRRGETTLNENEIAWVRESVQSHVDRLGLAEAPKPLCTGDLIEVLGRLPWNTPVLYQRLDDRFVDELGWEIESLAWDGGEMYLHYFPAFGYHIAHDAEGNVAFCIDLMSPSAARAIVRQPLAALSRSGYPRTRAFASQYRDLLARFEGHPVAHSDACRSGEAFFDGSGVASGSDTALALAACHNRVFWPDSDTRALTTSVLLRSCQGLAPDTAVYCQREADQRIDEGHWPTFTLSWEDGQGQFLDAYDCQMPKNSVGKTVLSINSVW